MIRPGIPRKKKSQSSPGSIARHMISDVFYFILCILYIIYYIIYFIYYFQKFKSGNFDIQGCAQKKQSAQECVWVEMDYN